MLNKQERKVIKIQLRKEESAIESIERQYRNALRDIEDKIRLLQSDELTQSRIYQLQYQKALKGQVEGILDKLQGDEYATIQQYLHDSYQDGFIGTMYSIHGQGIPLIVPIDQQAAVKAILTDSKIQEGLYESIGVDVKLLKKTIANEITRGIASNLPFADIARNIKNRTKAPLSRAKTIVRTEGHRIQQASANDARNAAKDRGCDVVKQWDGTLDGDTRPTHRRLDGQIRETDEPFEMDGKTAMYPGDFGKAEEDCNCRCVALTRAKWALDEEELEILKQRAKTFGLTEEEKKNDFKAFEEKYLKAAETLKNQGESGTMETDKTAFKMLTNGQEVNEFFGGKGGLLERRKSPEGRWLQGLTKEQREAVSAYAADGYGDLNVFLRKLKGHEDIPSGRMQEFAKELDTAIDAFELTETIVVQRGTMANAIDDLLDKYNIIDVTELVGKPYHDDGFMSTTALYGNSVATSKEIVFDIVVSAGKGRGAYINKLAGQYQDTEYEFLLKRGSDFVITEATEDTDLGKVYIKMVMQDD